MKMRKRILSVLLVLTMTACLAGCGAGTVSIFDSLSDFAFFGSRKNDIYGQLVGNSFECQFYDNYGKLFLTASGKKIGITGNIVKESTINSSTGGSERVYGLSSVVTINIDGKQIQSCGDTIIFVEKGLEPDAEFTLSDITSEGGGGLTNNTLVSGIVNSYKNFFGKPQVVIVQSQLGVPICAYSGEDVYWEVKDNLPKTTKLMIDGKALYIHRANFQIIDSSLIQ